MADPEETITAIDDADLLAFDYLSQCRGQGFFLIVILRLLVEQPFVVLSERWLLIQVG